MYVFLNCFFVIFHGSFTLFNIFGWAWKRTRRIHLYTISLTILSWIGLGLFYGWGYCPSTDWHWQVKRQLGEQNLPASYIKYYADYLTGMNWDPFVVNMSTAAIGISAFLLSIYFNWSDRKTKK
ncbi:MAG: DUF2784 domain-containing protein [Balneolaceae bacterium]|nr:DUF2784 domain-containing protein [Balneolaceae bacterium]